MNETTSARADWILPILLGGFSVLGICILLIIGLRAPAPSKSVPTATPFRYIYLGTEPGLSTLTPENTSTPVTPDTSTPAIQSTNTPAATSTNGSVAINTTQPPLATITPTIPFVLNKYDDNDDMLDYSGDWFANTNSPGAFHNTLHISSTLGSSVTLSFKGQQVIVAYQSGPSLGRVTLNLNGLAFEVDQADSNTSIKTWQSQVLVYGTYTLRIEHAGGGSINIDSITIPDLSTPTPTPTSTPTITPTS